MSLIIDFPATLIGRTEKGLIRNRIAAWIAFTMTLAAGLFCALFWQDPMFFARTGALGVIVGLVFARWRFLALRKAERKLERALRKPEQWLVEAILDKFPGLDVTPSENMKSFTRDEVQTTIDSLMSKVDNTTFRDEFAIIVISTLVWGFGDLVL